MAALHKTIWDEHHTDFVIQIRHEKAALALNDLLKSNLVAAWETAASLYIELTQNEA